MRSVRGASWDEWIVFSLPHHVLHDVNNGLHMIVQISIVEVSFPWFWMCLIENGLYFIVCKLGWCAIDWCSWQRGQDDIMQLQVHQ
jgi:hypothetical protein